MMALWWRRDAVDFGSPFGLFRSWNVFEKRSIAIFSSQIFFSESLNNFQISQICRSNVNSKKWSISLAAQELI